jgi:hypothetical protein
MRIEGQDFTSKSLGGGSLEEKKKLVPSDDEGSLMRNGSSFLSVSG